MPEEPITIAVVMAAFNRRETTLRCLRSLFPQASKDLRLEVYLLDDASPDGTGDAVQREFADVHVLHGDGQHFWGGGMYAAMIAASSASYDFMLWLNDDVELKPAALSELVANYRQACASAGGELHAIIGAVVDPASGSVSYAGFNKLSRWHPAKLARVQPQAGQLVPCDTMNGNCVLIPQGLVRSVGLIDPTYVQQLGDLDYGYRIGEAGGRIWLSPDAAGSCAPNPNLRKWQRPGISMGERLRILRTPHGLPLRPWITFMSRHAGPLGLLLLTAIYARALFQQRPLAACEHRSALLGPMR